MEKMKEFTEVIAKYKKNIVFKRGTKHEMGEIERKVVVTLNNDEIKM